MEQNKFTRILEWLFEGPDSPIKVIFVFIILWFIFVLAQTLYNHFEFVIK